MMKLLAVEGTFGAVSFFASGVPFACGDGGSCSLNATPVATASASATCSYSSASTAVAYQSPTMMRGRMMGGGMKGPVPAHPGSKDEAARSLCLQC